MNELQRKIQWSVNKDKRISFLSIFSSLCNLYRNKDINPQDIVKNALEVNTELYKSYPYPEEEQETIETDESPKVPF